MRLKLSIVKFEVSVPELRKALESFKENRLKAMEALMDEARSSVSGFINQLLNAEMTVFLGQPEQSDNKRNGFYEREYAFKHLGVVRVKMPIDRKSRFKSLIIPKHERMDPRLTQDLAALHLAGISTRMLAVMGQPRQSLGASPAFTNLWFISDFGKRQRSGRQVEVADGYGLFFLSTMWMDPTNTIPKN